VVIVLTTPRRPQFLGRTLIALDREGAANQQRLLCVDGHVADVLRHRVVPRGWEVISIGVGNSVNTQVAFHGVCAAIARRAGTDDVLFFEDDVVPCRHAVTGFGLIPVPDDCGFLAAFDHRNVLTSSAPRLLLVPADDPHGPQRGWGYWGNQALKLPRRTIAHLAKQRTDRTYVPHVTSRLYGSDVWLGVNAASEGAPWRRYGLIAPSLFQHIGAVSSVGTHWALKGRTAFNFRADFDALTLPELLRASEYFVNEFYCGDRPPPAAPGISVSGGESDRDPLAQDLVGGLE
jgi:hypothetical protein